LIIYKNRGLSYVLFFWFFENLLHSIVITLTISSFLIFFSFPQNIVISLSAPIWLFFILVVNRLNFLKLFNKNFNNFRFTVYSCVIKNNKRRLLDKVKFQNVKNIWRKLLVHSTIWTIIVILFFLILQKWLNFNSFEYQLYFVPIIFIVVNNLNLIYIFAFNKDIILNDFIVKSQKL
jgi:hypothetical protein